MSGPGDVGASPGLAPIPGRNDAQDTLRHAVQAGSHVSAAYGRTRYPGIYTRGSRYVVVWRDRDGAKRKKSACTLAEARELHAEMLAASSRGDQPPSRLTFADYAQTWTQTYQGRTTRGIRPETLADYTRAIERHAIPFFGKKRIAAITPQDVKAYAVALGELGIAPNTVRLAVAPVKALFATAVEDGVIRTNPAAGIRLAVASQAYNEDETAPAKALTPAQLVLFFAHVEDDWRLFFDVLLQTGMRVSEAIALRWSDVDLGRRQIKVQRRYYRHRFGPPKSRYGRRSIPIGETLARDLRTRRGAVADDVLVWPGRGGRPIEHDGDLRRRVLRDAATSAGAPGIGFHAFRHTCASALFDQGWNAVQVQRMLGHHSPAFTLSTYVHLMRDELPEPDLAHLSAPGLAALVAREYDRQEIAR
jgi:integrase